MVGLGRGGILRFALGEAVTGTQAKTGSISGIRYLRSRTILAGGLSRVRQRPAKIDKLLVACGNGPGDCGSLPSLSLLLGTVSFP